MEMETVNLIWYHFHVQKDGSMTVTVINVGLFLIIGAKVMRMIIVKRNAHFVRMKVDIVYHHQSKLQNALMVT
jgi:hypothetical protein